MGYRETDVIIEPSKAEFKGVRKPFNKKKRDKDVVSDKVTKPYKRDRQIYYEYEDID